MLVNSDFAAMPGIVGEGRRVINNIQRAATLFLVKNIFSLILAIITLFTNLPYPVIPLHLTVISSLTIGIPSFFLAMEPNYERIQGHFLKTVLRKAFPGGLTNILMILTAHTFMTVVAMAQAQISTICATILGVVGLLVLYQVCKPFDRFRKLIWCAMAILFVICFTFFGGFFELQALTGSSLLVLGCLLVMTPSIFFAVRYLFDLGEKIHNRFRT